MLALELELVKVEVLEQMLGYEWVLEFHHESEKVLEVGWGVGLVQGWVQV